MKRAIADLRSLGDEFCDCTVIAADGQVMRCHRAVLALGIPVLRERLSRQQERIELPEVPDGSSLEILIKYLYDGDPDLRVRKKARPLPVEGPGPNSTDQLRRIWEMANALQVPDLAIKCEGVRMEEVRQLRPGDALNALVGFWNGIQGGNGLDKVEMKTLEDTIKADFSMVLGSREFLKLSLPDLTRLVFFAREHGICRSSELVHALVAWGGKSDGELFLLDLFRAAEVKGGSFY